MNCEMFYEKSLLAKRGKFGVIWIAATREKCLKKRDYIAVDLKEQCSFLIEHIMQQPKDTHYSKSKREHGLVRFSLYLSAQLMFGVVRVFQHQHCILLEDLNSALSRHGPRPKSSLSKSSVNLRAISLGEHEHVENLLPDNIDDMMLWNQLDPQPIAGLFVTEPTPQLEVSVSECTRTSKKLESIHAPIDELFIDGFEPVEPELLFGHNPLNFPLHGDGKHENDLHPEALIELPHEKQNEVVPISVEPNIEVSVGKTKATKVRKVPGILIDCLENQSSRHGNIKNVSYEPEDPYRKNLPLKVDNTHSIYFDNVPELFGYRVFSYEVIADEPEPSGNIIHFEKDYTTIHVDNEETIGQLSDIERARLERSSTRPSRSANSTAFDRLDKDEKSRLSKQTENEPPFVDLQVPENPNLSFSGNASEILTLSSEFSGPKAALDNWLETSSSQSSVNFFQICPTNQCSKHEAAHVFIALLFFRKKARVLIEQKISYGDILITKLF